MEGRLSDPLHEQLGMLGREAQTYARFHAMQAGLGRRARYVYGLVSALLAAAAGTTALAEAAPEVVAFLAFASPVVAALQLLARPESRATEHHKLRSDYESLEGRIRIVDQVKYADLDKAARLEKLEAFTAELHELLAKTPGDMAVPGPNPTLLTVAWRQLRRRPLVSADD